MKTETGEKKSRISKTSKANKVKANTVKANTAKANTAKINTAKKNTAKVNTAKINAADELPEEVKKNVPLILRKLDEVYGVEKEGFYHHEPWQLLIAIMLSAQSTDKQVDEAIPALFDHFRTVQSMAEAPVETIEDYIRSVGLYKSKARNVKKCCEQIVEEYDGKVPDRMEDLLKLAGVGRKTANLFLSDAYGIPGVTVDTHVFRISKRLGWANGKNPAEVEEELKKVLPKDHWIRINFQLIYHGRAICTARKAQCGKCPLESWCAKRYEERR